jgi:hypothetical protein
MPSNFPSRAPVGLLTGVLSAVLCFVPTLALWHFLQSPVRQFYFGEYVLTSLSQTAVGSVVAFFRHSQRHTYYVLAQRGHLVWSDLDPHVGFSVRAVHFESSTSFDTWLRDRVYGGRELLDLLRVPMAVWCCLAVLFFGLGIVLDFRRRKRAREGQQLRGGELLSVKEFNRTTKGNGFALYVQK